jgi:hypothetical protein
MILEIQTGRNEMEGEIKIRVKETEGTLDAIKRHMKRNGWEYEETNQRGDYVLRSWYKDGKQTWITSQNFDGKTVTITLTLN